MRNVDGELDVLRERVERLEGAKPMPWLTEDEVREALTASDGCGKTPIDVFTNRLNILIASRTAKPEAK